VAPSVLLSFFAICDALVFLRAIVFSSRSSLEVHARRFLFLFAMTPPFQENAACIPNASKRKAECDNYFVIITFSSSARSRQNRLRINRNSFWHHKTKSSFRSLARMAPGSKRFLRNRCSRNYQSKSDYDSSIEWRQPKCRPHNCHLAVPAREQPAKEQPAGST
jgi:hypothetical protein